MLATGRMALGFGEGNVLVQVDLNCFYRSGARHSHTQGIYPFDTCICSIVFCNVSVVRETLSGHRSTAMTDFNTDRRRYGGSRSRRTRCWEGYGGSWSGRTRCREGYDGSWSGRTGHWEGGWEGREVKRGWSNEWRWRRPSDCARCGS